MAIRQVKCMECGADLSAKKMDVQVRRRGQVVETKGLRAPPRFWMHMVLDGAGNNVQVQFSYCTACAPAVLADPKRVQVMLSSFWLAVGKLGVAP